MKRTVTIILLLVLWAAVAMLFSGPATAYPAPFPTPSDNEISECAALYLLHASLLAQQVEVDPDPELDNLSHEITEWGTDIIDELVKKHKISDKEVLGRFLAHHLKRMGGELDKLDLSGFNAKYESKCTIAIR